MTGPALIGKTARMADDDDWEGGTPPEGHITRDRADPDFWRHQRPILVTGSLIVVVVIVIAIVLLVS